MSAATKQAVLRRTVLAGALLFHLYIAWTVFYSPLDDWQWSMDVGLWWLVTGVLNGRYMGNLFAVVMTRLPWLKTLFMALCMFALPYFMARLAARGRRERVLPLFVACNAGILLMPSVMWRETYFWVSGFGNFVVPTVFFLLLLLLLRRLDGTRSHPALWSGLLFFFLQSGPLIDRILFQALLFALLLIQRRLFFRQGTDLLFIAFRDALQTFHRPHHLLQILRSHDHVDVHVRSDRRLLTDHALLDLRIPLSDLFLFGGDILFQLRNVGLDLGDRRIFFIDACIDLFDQRLLLRHQRFQVIQTVLQIVDVVLECIDLFLQI